MSMRPREKGETKNAELDLASPDDEEKGPQGVRLEFKNVWFRYPTRDVPVLEGLNMIVGLYAMTETRKYTHHFQIEKGQFAAIVGPSGMISIVSWEVVQAITNGRTGCGKTSIISLLERYVFLQGFRRCPDLLTFV